MAYPAGYKYTKDHEWIAVDGAVGTVGITEYAEHSLGDIVFVELPKVGDAIKAGDTFGSIESVKSVSDLLSPVSGTISEINEELVSAPENINTDANSTWIVKIALEDATEIADLLDAAAYEKFVNEETGS